MRDAFAVVLFVVVGLSAVAALWALVHTGRSYDDIGRGGLAGGGGGPAPPEARDEEIRQMLGARNARRAARGEAPLDVESELAAMTRPPADPALEAEVRELVASRNRRRTARGRPPLDVEAEVARHLRGEG